MADLYLNQQGYSAGQLTGTSTGNEKIDAYLNTLPENERANALKEINAPLTGEEIAQVLKEDADWTPTKQQYDLFSAYQAKKEMELFDGMELFTNAASGIYDIAGNVISSMFDHPLEDAVKLAPSLIEGGVQNLRGWYGMMAQSQDPSSVLFKFKNALLRDGSDSAYKQFLEARKFARDSIKYETGQETMFVPKEWTDPALVQAATIVVDPMFYGSLLVPALGQATSAAKIAQVLGMSERLAKAAAFAQKMKGAVYGGALKAAGIPLEFIGDITRGVIDKSIEGGSKILEGATGVSAQDLKTATRVGGFGSIGLGVPVVSPVSKTYLGAGFASTLGESLNALGEQIMKNQGRRGLLSFAEQAILESDAMLAKGGAGLTPQARKLLNAINKVDPMFSYAGAFMEGGAFGAVIGGGLGALGGGEEGAWSGAGAGFGIGSLGGLTGRALSNYKGGLEKQRLAVQMDMLMPMIKDLDPTTHSSLELLREANKRAGNPDWVVDRYIVALDKIAPDTKFRAGGASENEARLKARGQDPKVYDGFERDANGNYKLDKEGNRIKLRDEEGYTIPTMDEYNAAGWTIQEGESGKIKIHINTDKFRETANTLPHEMFHGIFRELGMKSEFVDRINEHILGTFDDKGNQIKPPSISKYEAESFFTKYINKAYSGSDRDKRLAKLKEALNEYYNTGKMTIMWSDGKTPVLAHLTEEFGAYYWTHFLNDKPVDYLFRGGDLGGFRGVLDDVKSRWQDYMERKVGSVNGGFDFAREQSMNKSFLDAKGKRVRVSALDYMMQDLIRTKSASSRGEPFDFNKLSPEGQKAYVDASGDSITFEPPKKKGDKYNIRTPKQQDAIRAKIGAEMHKGLEAFRTLNPDALRIKDEQGNDIGGLSLDADGNYVGEIPDLILDYFVKSNHISRVESERIKIIQEASKGNTVSNVFEFKEYTGRTMGVGVGENVRAKGKAVPKKDRLVLVIGFENKIKPNDYSFRALTLDWRQVENRQENMWKDPKVRAAWGDDKNAFVDDLFRYFKNASQPEGTRIPSAQLWENNGEYKRNVMHQVAGIATPASGTINPSLGIIAGDSLDTFRQFRIERMALLRESGEKIDLRGYNAIEWIRHNMMPSDFSDEITPNGRIYKHPSGYKFIAVKEGFKAYKPDGTEIGVFKTAEEAIKKSNEIYQKENPTSKPIPSLDNIRQEPLDAPETQEQYVARKLKQLDTIEKQKDFLTSWGRTIRENFNGFNETETRIINKFLKEQYNREQQAVNPPFVSGLSLTLDKILSNNVDKNGTISASRLLNQLRLASGGDVGKILTESNVIGFTDWLKSKGQSRVSETEIRQYIQEKGIQVHIDPRAHIRGNEWQNGGFDTSPYVAEGKKEGYHTFVVRINPEHAHGVEGHFGEDSIVHIRATERIDAQGRKVLFVEEIQSINTARGVLSESQRIQVESDLVKLKKLKDELKKIENKNRKLHNENASRFESKDLGENPPEDYKKKRIEIQNTRDRKVTDVLRGYDSRFNSEYTNGKFTTVSNITMKISEKESLLAKKKSNKPLQDFPETVKIASRAIMRKAVELNVDRVVLVRPEDMHPAVTKNEKGERFVDALYGKDIPLMMNAELKKYGQQLRPAKNFDDVETGSLMKDTKERSYLLRYGSSELKETTKQNISKQILSESLGYDITPEMKQKAGRSQKFMMPSDESTTIPFRDWETKTSQETGASWSIPFYKKLEGAVLSGGSMDGIRILKVSEDKNGQVKLNVIQENKYQSIIKKYPEGKPRDNAIRSSSEDWKASERGNGEFRHPLFYLKNDIETIKFDASSTKPVKQISFNAQALGTAVSSIADELGGIEFDKASTSALFGRKSRTGDVKGIVQNLQDAVQELQRASTPEEKAKAQETINSHIEELRSLKDELQDKHDNTPESFQETEAYTKREDAIDALDEAITHIENTAEESGSSDSVSMMPSEGENGGRTYSDAEFKGSFIGAVAQKNPELIKGLSIKVLGTNKSFEFYLYDNKFSETSPIGEISTINTSLNNKENIITKAFIKPEYRGKGLGKLLYSELGERLKSLGIENLTGTIVDLKDRPFSLRASVFGESSTTLDKTEKYKVNTKLDPNARYMPPDQAQAWRDFKAEPTTECNSIFKNAMNFVIIQSNNKFKVYNPQKALLGIYTDLEEAKRRVRREEPKPR